ncbi:amidoligase family protein [Rhizobium sp. LjRoot30]|uniref:amidoligase family protein n=1 Tax=Rhizobium sp. LjRoot30 TaxID=3342320 RepID=UPI003ECDD240
MQTIDWTVGFEIELLAPPNSSRRDLAEEIARCEGANVRRLFYPQAEISAVTNKPVFETLTLGWEVLGHDGRPLARFVDDLTLQDDLDRTSAPKPGWYRILGDDLRLMRLLGRHCDAAAPIDTVLEPALALFGGSIAVNEDGFYKLLDSGRDPVAIAAPLPGERERACEIISRPLVADHLRALEKLLGPAGRLGFELPAEGAVHMHFDASKLATTAAMGRLVRFFHRERQALRERFRPNPRCRRLGGWSQDLVALVESPGFDELPWEEARRRMAKTGLTKFCDFNITNIVDMDPEKFTFEVRILPPTLDSGEIAASAAFFASVLRELSAPD